MNFYSIALEPFADYGFMRRALIACIALSISSAPLGNFLILRRMALVGDAMSHAILPGVSLAFLFFGLSLWPMTIGGLAAGIIVALTAGAVSRFTPLHEDASFTGAFILSLAVGVTIISMHGNSIDLMHVLFGNVLAVDSQSLTMVAGVATLSSLTLAGIYRPLVIECFDSGFLKAVRGGGGLIHYLFLTLLVLNLVASFQALGTMMSLGLLVLPAISARFWSRNIDAIVLLSAGLAVAASYLGLLLSYYCRVPSGPAIVLTGGGFYILSIFFGNHGSIFSRLLSHNHHAPSHL